MIVVSETEIILRLVLAVVLGGVIGFNRSRHNKPAGLRTMALISLGSAAFTLIGIEAVMQLSQLQTGVDSLTLGVSSSINLDSSRIIAGIVGGVGFLGAGAIIQSKGRVQGMTSAASIWVTSTIGVSVGLGLYLLATTITFIAFVVLIMYCFFGSETEEEENL
ncbi:MAG: MgtC/SapB family protein [Phycisphaerae bacterium]|jgi:putative Mg2+ transporter-C (MgtC) family protein|nr:MgtC/SapB family protein [Phycisphaerae bacterium]MBT5408860.1 MgtC/SapB family protein [Phycisphaerae bacterium]MBT6164290.1 MgtC/SapB family protein [Phycisphaerae bacterium]MBT7657355.1 MgtC/SapB family protein [Phycisphaerae bacterium]